MTNLHISQKLAVIQQKLKAPKGQMNKFGGYRYRSCEDILEAVKPLLGDCVLTISDDIREIGGRVYVEATARLGDSVGGYGIEVKALAREPESKKGMDESQITGAASSYARKYALNGLFCIDDTKDADATNNHKDEYQELCDQLADSIEAIKTGIEIGDLVMAKEAWDELTEEEKIGIWKAPSKGGCFTTEERTIMKSSEFRQAAGE